jgi:phosphate transport system permease protein
MYMESLIDGDLRERDKEVVVQERMELPTTTSTAVLDRESAQPGPKVQHGLAELTSFDVLQEQTAVREAARQPHELSVSSNLGDRLYVFITTAFAALVVAALALMIAVLLWQSRASLQTFGLSFVTSATWDPIRGIYGAAPSIAGTIYTSVLALLIAAPLGVMVAIFLVEISPRSLRFPLGFVIELLAAVPSIVYGLWALFVLVPIVREYIQPPLIDHFGNTPFFSGYPLGLGVFTASIILAIMILPTIAAISRDAMMAVPNRQRDAMFALGATRWEAAWKVVVPIARSGIIGGVILGLGRALGETMAVQMVIGNNTSTISLSVFNTGTTMPATIVNQFTEAVGELNRAALIEIALILMVLTVVVNGVARLLVWRTRG